MTDTPEATPRELVAAAEAAGVRADAALDYATAADEPVTDAAAFVARLAERHPWVRRDQPAPTVDDQREADGEAFMAQVDASRKAAGLQPLPGRDAA